MVMMMMMMMCGHIYNHFIAAVFISPSLNASRESQVALFPDGGRGMRPDETTSSLFQRREGIVVVGEWRGRGFLREKKRLFPSAAAESSLPGWKR